MGPTLLPLFLSFFFCFFSLINVTSQWFQNKADYSERDEWYLVGAHTWWSLEECIGSLIKSTVYLYGILTIICYHLLVLIESYLQLYLREFDRCRIVYKSRIIVVIHDNKSHTNLGCRYRYPHDMFTINIKSSIKSRHT